MTTRVATFPLRLPVSLKAALESISDRDGTSINQFLVVAAAEKIAAMQTEEFFLDRRNRADREAFRRILNRGRHRLESRAGRNDIIGQRPINLRDHKSARIVGDGNPDSTDNAAQRPIRAIDRDQ